MSNCFDHKTTLPDNTAKSNQIAISTHQNVLSVLASDPKEQLATKVCLVSQPIDIIHFVFLVNQDLRSCECICLDMRYTLFYTFFNHDKKLCFLSVSYIQNAEFNFQEILKMIIYRMEHTEITPNCISDNTLFQAYIFEKNR